VTRRVEVIPGWYRDLVRRLVVLAVLGSGCGPVPPASERAPVSGGNSTTGGDEGTRPGSSAPLNDDSDTAGDDDEVKLDQYGDGCPLTYDVEPLRSAIEVLVDASQGMANQLVDHDFDEGTPPITRWAMLAPALDEFLPALAEVGDIDVHVYPAVDAPNPPDPDACLVGPAPGFGAPLEVLLDELPATDATFMLGANPMSAAFEAAYDHLKFIDAHRKRVIVVVTDSAPNCAEGSFGVDQFDQVDAMARAWALYGENMNVRTHVVAVALPEDEWGGAGGDPFANHYDVLQDIANTGGSPLSIADGSDSLAYVLGDIVAKSRSCRTRLPTEVIGTWFWVEVSGQTFDEIGGFDCSAQNGFVYVDNGFYDTIELCADACTLFLEEGSASVVEDCGGFPELDGIPG
jgi:hypothetical protein